MLELRQPADILDWAQDLVGLDCKNMPAMTYLWVAGLPLHCEQGTNLRGHAEVYLKLVEGACGPGVRGLEGCYLHRDVDFGFALCTGLDGQYVLVWALDQASQVPLVNLKLCFPAEQA